MPVPGRFDSEANTIPWLETDAKASAQPLMVASPLDAADPVIESVIAPDIDAENPPMLLLF